jgi:hypothetical protein
MTPDATDGVLNIILVEKLFKKTKMFVLINIYI